MILSNVEILRCIEKGSISIEPLNGKDPSKPPFNTSSVDLHLGDIIRVPNPTPSVVADFMNSSAPITDYLTNNSSKIQITNDQPYRLKPLKLVLGQTFERVKFPKNDDVCYAARIEGRSSRARWGLIVHCTAPTVHAYFEGPLTLEIVNFGSHDILLSPKMSICQLIIEEIKGLPIETTNQYSGQVDPTGAK